MHLAVLLKSGSFWALFVEFCVQLIDNIHVHNMARDIEEKAGTDVPPPQDQRSSGEISSGPDVATSKELTTEQVAALKARVINENEEKQEEVKKQRGPTIPAASFWMKKNDEMFDQIATQPSIYDDPQLGKYLQPHPKYENLHRFDPSER